jgi:hypothetical protein
MRILVTGDRHWRCDELAEQIVNRRSEIFAVGVGGFSATDNHWHVLLRLEPDVPKGWSDDEVARRWGRLR